MNILHSHTRESPITDHTHSTMTTTTHYHSTSSPHHKINQPNRSHDLQRTPQDHMSSVTTTLDSPQLRIPEKVHLPETDLWNHPLLVQHEVRVNHMGHIANSARIGQTLSCHPKPPPPLPSLFSGVLGPTQVLNPHPAL